MRVTTLLGLLFFLAAAMAIPITSTGGGNGPHGPVGHNVTDTLPPGRNSTDDEVPFPGHRVATRNFPGRNSANPFPGHKVADAFFGPGGDGGHHNSTHEADAFFLPPGGHKVVAARDALAPRGRNSTHVFFPPSSGQNSTYPFLPPDIPVEINVEVEKEEEPVVVERGQYIDCIMSNQFCTPHTPPPPADEE
ncbi:hypothetical protein H2204_003100 [Knufia peltigerae]|uniref:Uncharacterized protein n=1 Tax=Knufia peltigerae TaxID=1002370 RepID=A0AA38YAC8_9EURO|nr:hypothetical protein H2204_003100 [Knufia peltigerae]